MRFTYAEAMTDFHHYAPLAQAAEEAGYTSMTVADSLIYPRESDTTYPYTDTGDRQFLEDKEFIETMILVAHLAAVSGMLEVLGIHPKAPEWSAQSSGTDLTPVVDGLVGALLDQRATARQAKDWAAADAIRDTLAGLGLEITDTPTGPRWSLEKK